MSILSPRAQTLAVMQAATALAAAMIQREDFEPTDEAAQAIVEAAVDMAEQLLDKADFLEETPK